MWQLQKDRKIIADVELILTPCQNLENQSMTGLGKGMDTVDLSRIIAADYHDPGYIDFAFFDAETSMFPSGLCQAPETVTISRR